ncbi:MAG: phosphoglucosamine mutase [Verrucomicrobiota bacterium]
MSQSRQFFGTDGLRGPANQPPLDATTVVRLGQAAAHVLGKIETQRSSVVIGKDTRESGDFLEQAIAAGLNSAGFHVDSAGVIPTPAVAHLTRQRGAAFGVVISASHNSFEDNGIKFFGPDGYKLPDETEAKIEATLLSEQSLESHGRLGRMTSSHEQSRGSYVDFVTGRFAENLLNGLHVALDAANGASFATSPAILERLGATVHVGHAEPDGVNINAACGCTHPDAIEKLFRESGAEVGISHDGDADRALLVDESGSILDGDEIMAIAATHLISEGKLQGNTLVATVMSNAGLELALNSVGGRLERAAVGDRYVIEKMRARGFNLGGEQSGHFIFHDHNTTGDGIIAAIELLRIRAETGKPLSELRKVLTKLPQVQRNLKVISKPPIEELTAYRLIQQTEAELAGEGRVLIRYSGTESLMRLLIEGSNPDDITRRIDTLAEAIETEIGA